MARPGWMGAVRAVADVACPDVTGTGKAGDAAVAADTGDALRTMDASVLPVAPVLSERHGYAAKVSTTGAGPIRAREFSGCIEGAWNGS